MNSFEMQYQLVRESRGLVFDLLRQMAFQQLTAAINNFNGKNVRFLAVHICNVYRHWIGNFALKVHIPYVAEDQVMNMVDLEKIFADVDALMNEFFSSYTSTWNIAIVEHLSDRHLSLTPLQLFTHVITHEFHHKGQIMTMCRLLGQVPPDTDIIRF